MAGAFLAGAFLAGAFLADADFAATFFVAFLATAFLTTARFVVARFADTFLVGAFLVAARLVVADFVGAFFIGAFFIGAFFVGALLTVTFFNEAGFAADLVGARLFAPPTFGSAASTLIDRCWGAAWAWLVPEIATGATRPATSARMIPPFIFLFFLVTTFSSLANPLRD